MAGVSLRCSTSELLVALAPSRSKRWRFSLAKAAGMPCCTASRLSRVRRKPCSASAPERAHYRHLHRLPGVGEKNPDRELDEDLPLGRARKGVSDPRSRNHAVKPCETAPFRRPSKPEGKNRLPCLTEWCGREDSNFHGLSATTTSTLRVYQFRHDRTSEGKPAVPVPW